MFYGACLWFLCKLSTLWKKEGCALSNLAWAFIGDSVADDYSSRITGKFSASVLLDFWAAEPLSLDVSLPITGAKMFSDYRRCSFCSSICFSMVLNIAIRDGFCLAGYSSTKSSSYKWDLLCSELCLEDAYSFKSSSVLSLVSYELPSASFIADMMLVSSSGTSSS